MKKFIAIALAIIILLTSAVLSITKSIEESLFSKFDKKDLSSSQVVLEKGNSLDKIAVLEIEDVITSGDIHEHIMKSLEEIRYDYDVKAVILKINSPGGGVYESAQIYEKIMQIRKERNLPFYASLGSVAASGGYYIAVACDKIYASEETTTGSIGVIMSSMNFAGLFEKYGVKSNVIKSGELKDIGSSSRDMTDKERRVLQSLVDNSYNKFVKVIVNGRNMSEEKVRKLADGRLYDGKQALELKLIDGFGYYEDVLNIVKTENDVDAPNVVSYEYLDGLESILSYLGYSAKNINKSEIEKTIDAIKKANSSESLKPMYLYGGM